MGSVSTASPNLSNLLQTIQNESPELSSILSTPQMQTALEKATPGDLVQLSDQALQMQQVALLFGASNGTQSSGVSDPNSLFSLLSPNAATALPDPLQQAQDASLGVAGSTGVPNGSSSSTPTASSLLNEIASNASAFQAQDLNALFGTPQTADPFVNTLG